jgi:MFS family permease
MRDQASHSGAHDSRPTLVAVLRVASGNFLEMYDFTIFGYYATEIGRTFFPSRSGFGSLMLALATFGVGFLMRPLGAVVLGAYVDEHGRRKGLLLTLALMSAGTITLACLPGYATLGLLAPLLVVAGRLLQGFSAGVELGGVSVYLAEIARPGRKGFYVAWQSASQQCAVIFAALLGVLMTSTLTSRQMNEWGWRIPLLFGCLIVPFLFVMRSSLPESGAFEAEKHHPDFRAVMRTLRENWFIILLGAALVIMTTVTFYVITAYTPTYGKTVLHLEEKGNLAVTLCVGVLNLCLLPVMGALSDRIGRRPLLIACTALSLVTAYGAMRWLVSAPSFGRLLTVELWFSFLYASYNAPMQVYLTELMPASVRASGFSIAYSVAAAIFGGFTPAICTWLIHETGNPAAPGLWLAFAAATSLAAVMILGRMQSSSKIGG